MDWYDVMCGVFAITGGLAMLALAVFIAVATAMSLGWIG